MNILFSIITYHPNPQQLNKLLAVLKPYQVLVIDNTKNNLGYAGGANKAIQQALKQDFDWIVILNQDLNVTKSAVKKFVSLLNKTKPSVAGPFLGTLDKKRWTTIKKIASSPSTVARGPRNDNFTTRYISGSFIAIHKDIIEKVGFFYEPYFMYYEDADYCIRAQKHQFTITEVKLSGVTHHDTTSLGQNSFLHEYYLARNHLLFVERYAPLYIKIRELVHLPLTIYRHYQNKNTGALTGVKDYLLRRFG